MNRHLASGVGGLLFLALIDISYNLWNDMYALKSAAMGAEIIIPLYASGSGRGAIDELDAQVENDYLDAIRKAAPDAPTAKRISRFEFYDRAEKAYACIVTGTTAKYGNIILKKGVTPVG